MTLVRGSTRENIALVPADQINVAYLPGLVSPVRITCVFLGDKKPQRKHLYLNHSRLQVFNQPHTLCGGYFWAYQLMCSQMPSKLPEYFPMMQCTFLLNKGVKQADGVKNGLCNLWVTNWGEKSIIGRVVECAHVQGADPHTKMASRR